MSNYEILREERHQSLEGARLEWSRCPLDLRTRWRRRNAWMRSNAKSALKRWVNSRGVPWGNVPFALCNLKVLPLPFFFLIPSMAKLLQRLKRIEHDEAPFVMGKGRSRSQQAFRRILCTISEIGQDHGRINNVSMWSSCMYQ